MYNNPVVPAVVSTGGGAIAASGMGSLWLGLAAFAMIALAAALMRIVPRAGEGEVDQSHWGASVSTDAHKRDSRFN